MNNIKRLYILSEAEITDLYARPTFTLEERKIYFAVNQVEFEALEQYSAVKTRIYFILQLAYFKAKHQFFAFTFKDVKTDAKYVLSRFFKGTNIVLPDTITRQTISHQQQVILKLFNAQDWSTQQAERIEAHLCELLRYYPKVHDAFRQLLVYFDTHDIIVPTYRNLQDLFTQALSKENDRLSQLMLSIPNKKQEQLLELLDKEDGISLLNIIRSDQKDFTYTAVRAESDKALKISNLYLFAKRFLPKLKLSKNTIRYYADLAEQYAASRLRRLNKAQQLLQITCFIYHRYQQIMNNLITSFMYHTRYIIDGATADAEKKKNEHNARLVVDLPKLAQFLKWFPHRNSQLSHDEVNQEAYKILPEKDFSTLVEFLGGSTFDKKAANRDFYLESSRLFALYLRPIVLAVSFVFYKDDSDIIDFIEIIKDHYSSGKSPSAFKLPQHLKAEISNAILPYLKKNPSDTELDPYLFEFFVYQRMYRRLDKGLLCCNDSVSYCDIDNDLVSDSLVDKIEEIANEFGYPKIPIYCDQRLDDALQELDNAWERTTQHISNGENTAFNINEKATGEKDWSLGYDSKDKLEDAFFKTLPPVDIADITMHIGYFSNMWGCFTHIKTRYNKRKQPVPLAVNACVLFNALGIEIDKMTEMSDLNRNLLRSTQEDFIRIDTLCAASDCACNIVHSLPIFKAWDLMDNKLLADADGQKLPTTESTIQSRYSKKYLGKSPGISIYTLIANFIAVNAKTIGLNEYEGHSLYDMINGNKTDVDIDMVTGDNHSLNQLNFVALDSIDVDYVPSIKNIKEAAKELYSVKPIDQYTGIIAPKGVIDRKPIVTQKRSILRLLLSLLLQENTQSNIIRKINSSARYAGLRKALSEYNKILKSTHILNLLDDMDLRKAIRTARNRTEAYHQLQGLIRKIYSGVFKGKKITTNRISAHAVRLVANCIIAYNSIILNAVYEKMLRDGVSQKIIDRFLRISPIAWAYIVFTGKYNFKKSNGQIDITAMVDALEKHLRQHFWNDD